MYLEYFGLAESPFRITPHTDFFFDGANRGATLDALIYAITHDEGIVKVTGEVGSGKTMLCRVLMERLPENVTSIYLANPSLSREDILYAIADELQLVVPDRARLSSVLKALHDHLIKAFSNGRQVVVLIDEAHAMPAETLEEIRLLSNLESRRSKLLQLVMFGQPELNDILGRADMRQLKERITHNFVLEPLVRDDIAHYLDFRLRAAGYRGPDLFTQQAIKHISKVSQGLTRRINILADKALLSAFSSGVHQVGLREAKRAAADSDFSTATYAGKSNFRAPFILLLILGAIALPAILFYAIPTFEAKPTFGPQVPIVPAEKPFPATPVPPTKLEGESTEVETRSTPGLRETSGYLPVGEPGTRSAPLPQPTAGTPVAGSARNTSTPTRIAGNSVASSGENPSNEADLGPKTKIAMKSGLDWLSRTPNDKWFIQLYTTQGRDSLLVEEALRKINAAGINMDLVRVYSSDLSGVRRVGVTFGEFETRAQAMAEIRRFPRQITALKPYPRQVVRLK